MRRYQQVETTPVEERKILRGDSVIERVADVAYFDGTAVCLMRSRTALRRTFRGPLERKTEVYTVRTVHRHESGTLLVSGDTYVGQSIYLPEAYPTPLDECIAEHLGAQADLRSLYPLMKCSAEALSLMSERVEAVLRHQDDPRVVARALFGASRKDLVKAILATDPETLSLASAMYREDVPMERLVEMLHERPCFDWMGAEGFGATVDKELAKRFAHLEKKSAIRVIRSMGKCGDAGWIQDHLRLPEIPDVTYAEDFEDWHRRCSRFDGGIRHVEETEEYLANLMNPVENNPAGPVTGNPCASPEAARIDRVGLSPSSEDEREFERWLSGTEEGREHMAWLEEYVQTNPIYWMHAREYKHLSLFDSASRHHVLAGHGREESYSPPIPESFGGQAKEGTFRYDILHTIRDLADRALEESDRQILTVTLPALPLGPAQIPTEWNDAHFRSALSLSQSPMSSKAVVETNDERFERLSAAFTTTVGCLELRPPSTPRELLEWGMDLDNCITQYAMEHFKHECLLIGVFKRGDLIAALEVRTDTTPVLNQFEGKHNTPAPDDVERAVLPLLESNGVRTHKTNRRMAA